MLPWTMLVQIDDSWLRLTHKRLLDAFDELDPEVGEEIHIKCLGRSEANHHPYDYEVTVADRTWSSGE